jgi:hypothetical protein
MKRILNPALVLAGNLRETWWLKAKRVSISASVLLDDVEHATRIKPQKFLLSP